MHSVSAHFDNGMREMDRGGGRDQGMVRKKRCQRGK